MPISHALLMLACMGLTLCCGNGFTSAAPRTMTISTDLIGDVTLLAPADEPKLFVVFVSGKDGVTPVRTAEAEKLVAKGAAVALVDLSTLIAKQAASDDVECHYVFGDIEDFTRIAERQLGMANWRWPILLGAGEGGALAYLALAQAPDNTAAGAVSIGFEPQLATKLPFCPGAPNIGRTDGVYSYAPMKDMPGRWTWINMSAPAPRLAGFADPDKGGKLEIVSGGEDALFSAASDAVFDIGSGPAAPLADLPLIELPASNAPEALAVFISGDGGWRDIDKQIGEYMAAQHVGVIGVDSLRYFWSHKEPKQIAADLDRIVTHYRKKWQLQKTALLGYSLGADVLPLAWPDLSAQTQEATVVIGLLGLEPTAELEVSVTGWLGLSSSKDVDVRPFLTKMPPEKVMCFYGVDEKDESDTACVFPELANATRVERPGGHHFDGNYEAVAEMILSRLNVDLRTTSNRR